jgi:peptidyl-prolyl cis-trans isomerase SurA
MRSLCLFLVLSFLGLQFTNAQKQSGKVLLSINNNNITADEFERIYNKNNQVGTAEKETVENYFDLFLKFKLKVHAAIDAGLDTISAFKTELKGYRDQLAKSYLTDNETFDKLVKEAVFRTETQVAASHIMAQLPQNPTPSDTLAAYNKIISLRKRIVNGESFEKVAMEQSDDPNAKTNKGYLGYFSAMRVPYSFESAAFNTPVGEVSQPVRTRFGYHLIKVINKRTSPGEVKVAHIMVAVPEESDSLRKAEAEKKINDIYNRLKKDEVFDTLARKMSDDQYSARNNGELPWFGSGQMVPEFEEAAFAIANTGDICKPVKTFYGWHIIKLIDRRPPPTTDKIESDIKGKIASSDRNSLVRDAFIAKLKKSYKYQTFTGKLDCFYKLDSLVFTDTFQFLPDCDTMAVVLTIEKKNYHAIDFRNFMKTSPKSYANAKGFIDDTYNSFIGQSLINYEDSKLAEKYPDFKNLVQEYYEGILLFNIMEKEVWNKASEDSVGLEEYFKKNESKYNSEGPKQLEEIRGIVISDYQNYLEDLWIQELKKKYAIKTDDKLLQKIAKKYKN